ncbi:MAG: TIGR04086 family membrane protein [Clostridia bacterium]|nr:TIGR04086 family membrane protein [Clostridia bacterium]
MTAFTRSVLWALLAATLTAAVLIFIFALWAFNSDDPSSLVGPLGMTAFFISCFTGGIVSRRGEGNLLTGLIFGVIFIFVCFAISLIFESERGIGTLLLTYLGGLAAAILGGIFFGGKKARKPKTLKKYNKIKRK